MRKANIILLYATALIVLLLLLNTYRTSFMRPGVAFVDIGKVVENYKMKKELEDVASKDLYKIKNVVDSLKMIKRSSRENRPSSVDSQLAYAQYAFQKYYKQTNEDINKKIWERLNPLMEEYGKDKGLEILIGANGAGTVLYGCKNKDLTDDVIKYINIKYEKGS